MAPAPSMAPTPKTTRSGALMGFARAVAKPVAGVVLATTLLLGTAGTASAQHAGTDAWLASRYERLSTDPEFNSLDPALRTASLEALKNASAEQRPYVSGLVGSGTYAALDRKTQDELLAVVAGGTKGAQRRYRELISSSEYQALATPARVERLKSYLAGEQGRLAVRERFGALLKNAQAELRPHIETLRDSPSFALLDLATQENILQRLEDPATRTELYAAIDPLADILASKLLAVIEQNPEVDRFVEQRVPDELMNRVIDFATRDWQPHQRQSLKNIIEVLDQLAGGDGRLNYGDKMAIISALLSDTNGLIQQAHNQVDQMLPRRGFINRVVKRKISKAFQPTRRPLVRRIRANRRAKIYSAASCAISQQLDRALSQAGVRRSTAHPVDGAARNLTIAQMMQLEHDIEAVRSAFGGLGSSRNTLRADIARELFSDLLAGKGMFDDPLFADGIPTVKRPGLYLKALLDAME